MGAIDKRLLKIIKKRFQYDDEEIEIFKNDPRNVELINRHKELADTKFILEVVESKGCNSNHQVGDRFYFDFAGNILTELSPPKICGYSLNSAMMMSFTANEKTTPN